MKWKPRLKSKSKPKFKNCSAEQQETIIAAAKTAQKAAIDAYSSLKAIKGPAPRYTTWFGGYNDVRKEMVDAIFKGIKNTPFQKLTYDCLCHEKVRDTANAYVSKYTFQLRSRRSVPDRSLYQPHKIPNECGSAIASGTQRSAIFTGEVYLSTRPPTTLSMMVAP